jgi:tetratricopeptide (TPR) repeat protein
MKKLDEDSTLSKLCESWIGMARGCVFARNLVCGVCVCFPHEEFELGLLRHHVRAFFFFISIRLVPCWFPPNSYPIVAGRLRRSRCAPSNRGELLKEAFYNYEELAQKYGETSVLLNGQASAYIQQGLYDEAEGVLLSAQEKDPDFAETLINLNSVSNFLGKAPEVSQRYLSQLKDQHPTHPYTVALQAAEDAFDQLCA